MGLFSKSDNSVDSNQNQLINDTGDAVSQNRDAINLNTDEIHQLATVVLKDHGDLQNLATVTVQDHDDLQALARVLLNSVAHEGRAAHARGPSIADAPASESHHDSMAIHHDSFHL